MYSRTIKLFDPQAVPAVAAALYTVPANTRTRITKLVCTNTATTTRLVTVYLVPTGDTAAAANTIIQEYAIGPDQDITLASAIGHVLETGDSLQAIVDAGTDLMIHASGTEVTI